MLVMSRLVCFSARLAFDLGYGVCFIGFVFGWFVTCCTDCACFVGFLV